jgi:hypothetical protein
VAVMVTEMTTATATVTAGSGPWQLAAATRGGMTHPHQPQ